MQDWNSLQYHISPFVQNSEATLNRLVQYEFKDDSPKLKALMKLNCEVVDEVNRNYANVVANIQSFKDAKLGLEYLKELGFDTSELLAADQQPATTALAVPADTRLMKDVPYGEMDTVWLFDEEGTMVQDDYFRECLFNAVRCRFPSFDTCNEYVGWNNKLHAAMKNRLFYICIEDNESSLAVELIQRDDVENLHGLQAGLYQKYLNGIRDALFEQFETIGVYGGPWTSGRIKKDEVM